VTVKGPGRIANFSTGILIGPISSNAVLIYNLVFTGNQTGIAVTAGEGTVRALQNVIVGKKKQGSGIVLAVTSNVYIYQNTIKDYADAVLIEGEVQNAVVDENLIIHNQTGISASSPDNSCSTIRGNRVKFNEGNGIEAGGPTSVFLHTATSFTCPGAGSDIEDNTVSFNRGSGIVAGAGLAGTRLVQDNLVSFNKIDGISVIGTDITETPGPVQVIGNYVVRNGTDLVWDGVGTGNCWQQNIFGTSSPRVLPACQ
jgi:nitrous oxidase accessory protein NosD